ncbi:cell separation during budding [Rhizophlyctis rosea]|nr:cell separation during budding [Rhizophlyctis rosea]
MATDREYEPVDYDLQPQHEGLGFQHKWYDVPCGELLEKSHQNTVIIPGEIPVESACELLVKNGISSAPVWDNEKKVFVGMFDFRDVVQYVLLGLGKGGKPDEASFEVQEIVRKAQAREAIPTKLAADLSHKNPFYSVMEATPILQLIEIFGKGVHRVAVTDGDNMKGIISQSTVMQFLWARMERYPDLIDSMGKTLNELGLGSKNLITADGNRIVLDALKLMSENDVSSVGILGPDGSIVANLSMSDIKWAMKSSRFGLLWETCIHFISFIDQEQGMLAGKDKQPVFDVLDNSTLGYAVGKMVATKAHRVWVVERARGRPMSVVSLTDVYRILNPAVKA